MNGKEKMIRERERKREHHSFIGKRDDVMNK